MRAIVQHRYGTPGELRLQEVDRPVPADDEVLVAVRAASVHPDVWHVVTGRPYLLRLMGSGVRRPRYRVPGTDLAGVVEAVGPAVTAFRPGDEVFGESLRGMVWRHGGAFAEYAVAPEEGLAPKPANVSFEQAATVPSAGYILLVNVPLALLRPGARVLVNGAAGGVGAIAVQLAKARGAHVTGVERPGRLDLVRSLGADHVIDSAAEDFTRGADPYDVIVDIPGNRTFAECRRVLTAGGRYILIGHDAYGRAGRRWLGSVPRFAGLGVQSLFRRQLRGGGGLRDKRQAMATLGACLAAGELTPVVARTFPLAEAGRAVEHLAQGEARGRIVVVI